jgi:hypothetical protein
MPFATAAASVLARRRWSFVAGACLLAAIALWFVRGADAAFVAATLGVVAWFWDQRNRLRPLVIEAEREKLRARDEEEFDDDEDVDQGDDNRFEPTGDDAKIDDDKEADIDREVDRETDDEATRARDDFDRRPNS